GWAKAARRFAATHGPQFEAATVGKFARVLARHDGYAALARRYAAEADRLAVAAGMRPEDVKLVAADDEEPGARAARPEAPPAGSTWTVKVTGGVVDAKGDPVAGAEVIVNNMQWARVFTDDGSYKATTGPDGRYTITLKCQGTHRLHVTKMFAQKR